MKLSPIKINISQYPAEFRPLLSNAQIYDSSCSASAKVIFIDKGDGYFLKSAPKGALKAEAEMTAYFHGKKLSGFYNMAGAFFCNKGLSAAVINYISNESDWLLTERIRGEDCVSQRYLDEPERLCDVIAKSLKTLHSLNYQGCPVSNHTEIYLETAERNYFTGNYNKDLFPDNWGYASAEEAYNVVKTQGRLLETNTLLHGDYCLPNIILDEWKLGGFVDLGNGGVGDRHVDIFWGIWTLFFNLKTDKYRERFIDVYGRQSVDEERLKTVAAAEVFL